MVLNATVLNATVLILKVKAQANCDLANCSSVLDEKDSCGQETYFLTDPHSLAVCMPGLNAMGSNKLD
jgi:hypothetical protein